VSSSLAKRSRDRVQRAVARQDQIQEDGRAFDIKIPCRYRAPQYSLRYEAETSMSPTGEWTIFRLEHPDGHWYRGRWDERKSALDIDLFPTGTAGKPEKNFPGHHTCQPNPNARTFDVEVHRDNVRIFSALVTFTLARRISLHGTTATMSALLTPQQGRTRWWQSLCSRLHALWFR
jgi:hypothetical protein